MKQVPALTAAAPASFHWPPACGGHTRCEHLQTVAFGSEPAQLRLQPRPPEGATQRSAPARSWPPRTSRRSRNRNGFPRSKRLFTHGPALHRTTVRRSNLAPGLRLVNAQAPTVNAQTPSDNFSARVCHFSSPRSLQPPRDARVRDAAADKRARGLTGVPGRRTTAPEDDQAVCYDPRRRRRPSARRTSAKPRHGHRRCNVGVC